MLCAVPALRALRSAFPRAEITLIGLPWAHAFAARFPKYIDRFLPFAGFPGLPEQTVVPRAVLRFLRLAQAQRFELAIQLHGSGEISNSVVSLLGARETAGFMSQHGQGATLTHRLAYPDAGTEVERLLALARFLGARNTDSRLEFPVAEGDIESLCRVLPAKTLPEQYLCVHPGSASAAAWPTDRFAAAADAMAERGLRVVLTGTAREWVQAQAVARAMRHPCIDLVGKTDLYALAALLAHARLLISNDTGVAHLAQAVNTRSVVIFTTADAARWAPQDRRRHRVLQAASSAQVIRAACELLDQEREDADAA